MTRVLIPLFLMLCLTACATERIVEKPVVVKTTEIKWREIPAELTRRKTKQQIPEAMTYGEALEAWSRDRATIDTLNGQLLGIISLTEPENDGSP